MADTSTQLSSVSAISQPLVKQHISWQKLTLAAILLLSAFLEFFQLNQEGYANTYYAAGIKSMLTSWHNFFFVSFDSAGFVALDKPPLGFWIQAASAKLFGFSGFSLLLPQALAGVLSVALLYFLIARTFGSLAGLFAALALTLTPITVVTDRNNTIDSLLILTLLLAVWTVIYASETGHLRWLLLGAVLVGLGFNIKMLQAYLVVPALGMTYLLGAPGSWKKRIAFLLLAGVVLLAVSLSWAIIVDLTPAALRPYVSDSGTNSELSLILGYNGLGRVSETIISHIGVLHFLSSTIDLNIAPAFAANIGNPSLWRLLTQSVGDQVSWLLPLALIGLIAAITRIRPHLPFDRYGQSVVMWGTWLLTATIYFSTSRFFHLYYLIMLGPAIAAMAGIGVSIVWQEYRSMGWRGWFLPAALLLTAIAQIIILTGYSNVSYWMIPLIIFLTALTIGICIILRIRHNTFHKILPGTVIVALLTLLIAPTVWDIVSLQNNSGSAWLPQAGPTQGFAGAQFGGQRGRGGFRQGGGTFNPGNGGFGGAAGGVPGNNLPSGTFPTTGRGGFAGGAGGVLTVAGPQWNTLNPGLVSYLKAQQGQTRFLVATTTSSLASVFMLATNEPAMAWGGYQGWDRIVTPAQLAQLVDTNTVRFFYIPSTNPNSANTNEQAANPGGFGGQAAAISNANASVNNDLITWVQSSCSVVPTSTWQTSSSSTSTPTNGGFGGAATAATQLYDCAHHR